MYSCTDEEIGGVVKMSREDAIKFMQSRGKKADFLELKKD